MSGSHKAGQQSHITCKGFYGIDRTPTFLQVFPPHLDCGAQAGNPVAVDLPRCQLPGRSWRKLADSRVDQTRLILPCLGKRPVREIFLVDSQKVGYMLRIATSGDTRLVQTNCQMLRVESWWDGWLIPIGHAWGRNKACNHLRRQGGRRMGRLDPALRSDGNPRGQTPPGSLQPSYLEPIRNR